MHRLRGRDAVRSRRRWPIEAIAQGNDGLHPDRGRLASDRNEASLAPRLANYSVLVLEHSEAARWNIDHATEWITAS
jgi:hypothetical protein